MLKLTLSSRTLILVPLLALVAAAGQDPPSNWSNVRMLTSGTEVRVIAAKAQAVSAKLESATDSTVVITAAAGQQTFDRAQIASISVKKNGHRFRNTLIGFAAGLVAGLGLGTAVGHNCTGFWCGPGDVILGGIVGVAGGTTAGAVWPTGGWRKIYQR
jgi:hypothetical protein